ncbi:Ribosomal protein L32p [Candidatus Omnitrophus magneticus]|uniref:Large ribosomal subunit protein bL32 n=1 Tax=Candidatus Omnitrophus magneticus TaxID=1609969 RepID=A0A0F0CPS6_9BACT|nr:Ribosomal protein L32p [Candidatus Omnitrophus magneticus]
MPKVKHRHSKARGRKRRTHYKAVEPAMGVCPECNKPKMPHRICLYCGYYKAVKLRHFETIEERESKRGRKVQ